MCKHYNPPDGVGDIKNRVCAGYTNAKSPTKYKKILTDIWNLAGPLSVSLPETHGGIRPLAHTHYAPGRIWPQI